MFRRRVAGHLPHREAEMSLADFAGPRDPAAAVILTVQRETLAKFGQELLAKQRAAMAQVETEMERTVVDFKDGELYVRIDRGSLVQGGAGNWYARAARLDLRQAEATPADLTTR
jgi:hypothetical protein